MLALPGLADANAGRPLPPRGGTCSWTWPSPQGPTSISKFLLSTCSFPRVHSTYQEKFAWNQGSGIFPITCLGLGH